MMRCICICILMCAIKLSAQIQSHPLFRNYSVDQGLPSAEVYGVEQDNDGYLWFVTDHGVSRYDGYEFKDYGKEQGLDEIVILKIKKDKRGRIWLASMAGNLYIIENNNILKYDYNHIIHQYLLYTAGINFYLDEVSGSVLLPISEQGILEIRPDGSHYMHRSRESPACLIKNFNGVWVAVYTDFGPNKMDPDPPSLPVEIDTGNGQLQRCSFDFPGGDILLCQLHDDTLMAATGNFTYLLKGAKLLHQGRAERSITSVKRFEDGTIWVCYHNGGGLRRFSSIKQFTDDTAKSYFPNISVSNIYKDRENKYWICTVTNGVWYCGNWEQVIYDVSSDIPDKKIMALTVRSDSSLYIGLTGGSVYALNTSNATVTSLPYQYGSGFTDLYWSVYAGKLYALASARLWLERQLASELPAPFSYLKIYPGSDSRHIWLRGGGQRNYLDIEKNEIIFQSARIFPYKRHISSYFLEKNQILLGTTDGLFLCDGDTMQPVSDKHPAFSNRIEDIRLLKDSTWVIATKGAGIVFWKDNQFQQYTRANGLLTGMIEEITVQSDHTIWARTFSGAIQLERSNAGPWLIKNYTTKQGLPSNEILDIACTGGKVWVATSKGLTAIQTPEKTKYSPVPIPVEWRVNGKVLKDIGALKYLNHKQQNIHIHFRTIRPHLEGNIFYRYRLQTDDPWLETTNTDIEMAALAPGNYALAIQSQNESGIWSESLDIPICIQLPWWSTTRFRVFVLLLMGGLALLWVRWMFRRAQKEARLQQQLFELERQALQSQMNPHFIFNCLNSIQRLVVDGEIEKTVRYLFRFAQLIRQNLQFISKKEIPLNEEIVLLENYLELELLRHRELFEYKIEISPELDTFDVAIPPMLLQPFIENAILHGIYPKKEKGLISIRFTPQKQYLGVTITDNGVGFQTPKGKKHHSLGIEMVKKRLTLFNGISAEHCFSIQSLSVENDQPFGTVVQLKIRIE